MRALITLDEETNNMAQTLYKGCDGLWHNSPEARNLMTDECLVVTDGEPAPPLRTQKRKPLTLPDDEAI